MERAALKVAEELERTLADKKQEERILCVCGSGNNGGDGVAVARILKLHGYRTSLYLVGNPDHRTVEMQRQLDIAAACQVPVVNNLETEEYTTIVDAIFGVGLSRPVEGSYRDVIMALNQLNAWKVAVDIPSGVNGDTGAELGIAFHADLTVTFAFRKAGLCLYPGRKFAGKVIVADVGIYASDKVKPYLWQTEKTDIHFLPDKIVDGNKGTFGKILDVYKRQTMHWIQNRMYGLARKIQFQRLMMQNSKKYSRLYLIQNLRTNSKKQDLLISIALSLIHI